MTARSRFHDFTAALTARAIADTRIVGVVAMGSTAHTSRVDEWSDHDVAIVVTQGTEAEVRERPDWLPDPGELELYVLEHHGGGKAMYRDGHIVEFGVTTVDGLLGWHANSYRVLYGDAELNRAMAQVAAKPHPQAPLEALRETQLALIQLLIGTGRARRGEVLSANALVRLDAVEHILRAVALRRPTPATDVLDPLDPTRRIELAYPQLCAEIARALELQVAECTRRLLDIAERALAPGWQEFPHSAAEAVRRRLDWPRPDGDTR